MSGSSDGDRWHLITLVGGPRDGDVRPFLKSDRRKEFLIPAPVFPTVADDDGFEYTDVSAPPRMYANKYQVERRSDGCFGVYIGRHYPT